jgi:hypothetical protein
LAPRASAGGVKIGASRLPRLPASVNPGKGRGEGGIRTMMETGREMLKQGA